MALWPGVRYVNCDEADPACNVVHLSFVDSERRSLAGTNADGERAGPHNQNLVAGPAHSD